MEERGEIERIFATEEARRLVTALRSRKDDARIEVLDAAYWVKGCSSLGRLRFAILLGIGKNYAKKGGLCLTDIAWVALMGNWYKWRVELGRNRPANLDAPSWLWSSIVELLASHEAAYLEHFSKYVAGWIGQSESHEWKKSC